MRGKVLRIVLDLLNMTTHSGGPGPGPGTDAERGSRTGEHTDAVPSEADDEGRAAEGDVRPDHQGSGDAGVGADQPLATFSKDVWDWWNMVSLGSLALEVAEGSRACRPGGGR